MARTIIQLLFYKSLLLFLDCECVLVVMQGLHSPGCWPRCGLLRPCGRVRHRHCGRCGCPGHSTTAASLRRNDFDPYFCRSIGSLRFDCCYLSLHKISARCKVPQAPRNSCMCCSSCSSEISTKIDVARFTKCCARDSL